MNAAGKRKLMGRTYLVTVELDGGWDVQGLSNETNV